MLTHGAFAAWIVSNNQPLPEYLVAVDHKASRVSCWIPSEAGKVRFGSTSSESLLTGGAAILGALA